MCIFYLFSSFDIIPIALIFLSPIAKDIVRVSGEAISLDDAERELVCHGDRLQRPRL
jgi:hypothetical protein